MSALFPFQALRPTPDAAAHVASVPYDVVTADEARALAAGNPLSFLHVTRSEIDLPAGTNPYDATVYARAADNLRRLTADAPLLVEAAPALYCYRLRMGRHEQTGVAGCFAVDEYDRGLIKKHERTRRDKEDDRTRHITTVGAQTGLVLLTYRARAEVDVIVARITAGAPLYDLVAADDVRHVVWRVPDEDEAALIEAFGTIDALYIADGHHRAASASRAREARGGAGESSRFVAVAFPDAAMQVLPYNRVVADLAGRTPEALIQAIRAVAHVSDGGPVPARAGDVAMFLAGCWYRVELPRAAPGTPRAEALDVAVLQERVLAPLFGIADPRTDRRIDFVGGIRGAAELERLVSSGRAAVAFSMHPAGVGDLMAIADEGGIMPPKSTWFEPKLRDGLLVHAI
jgi:uncharacterized protein (DUF1015 family)